jgi:Mg-chelatase subunit ChlD/sugar lactone lactonase YvrE
VLLLATLAMLAGFPSAVGRAASTYERVERRAPGGPEAWPGSDSNLPQRTGRGVLEAHGGVRYVLQADWPLPEAPAEPIDLALAADGTLYVADGRQNAVLVYGAQNTILDVWTDPPTGPLPGYVYVPRAVATDSDRGLVYVLWQRFREEPPHLLPTGLFLDTRLPGGLSARPLQAITFVATADDLAVDPRTGDIFIMGEGYVSKLRMPARVPIPGFPVGTAGGRMEVTREGLVAIANPGARRLDLYTTDGAPAGRRSTGELEPLAVASDGEGNLHVLVRAPDASDPSAPLILVLRPSGAEVREIAAAALGAPVPPEGSWPYAIVRAGNDGVLTTGARRFWVQRLSGGRAAAMPLVGARVRASYTPRGEDVAAIGAGVSLAFDDQAGLLVLDVKASQILRVRDDGRSELHYGVPDSAVDFAAGPSGEVYVTADHGRLVKLAGADPDAQPIWDVSCDCGLGGRVAASSDYVFVSRTREQSVAAFRTADGVERHWFTLEDAVGLWPSDVETDSSGLLYTGDMVTARVQSWAQSPEPTGQWQTGLLAGPRRLAVGESYDGTDVLVTLMGDGYVEMYSIDDGNLVSRWLPRGRDGSLLAPSDVAIGAQGEIYIADARQRRIFMFAPGAGVPATPEPEPAATATPSELSCIVRGDKVAAPSSVVLGQTAGVTLTLAASCPSSSRLIGADIVLVIDRSGSMEGAKMVAARRSARSFAELLDVRYHRIGLASFSSDASVDVPLTDDIPAVIDGLEMLSPGGGTNMAAALERARANLRDFGREEALPVIVMLSDGRNNDGMPDPRPVAQEVRNWGAQIYTIGLGGDVDEDLLREIAGGGGYFFAPTPSELFPIYGDILRIVLSSLAGNLIIDDELSETVEYVDGSSRPAALVSTGRLRWGRSILPSSGLTLTYRVRPLQPGCSEVNRHAVADYTDADGERRRYTFPVPTICALTPTPTPTASATPTASPTPTPVAVHVPVAFKGACLPGKAHASVVLLIDTSSSMAGEKLTAAKTAAGLFVDLLQFPRDQVAVVGFSAEPYVASVLTRDAAAARRAIDGLAVGRGTRIDSALWAAARQLRGQRRDVRNRGVIVLMTDGGQSGRVSDVLDLAGEVRAMPATIYAIGLGADADGELLRAVAGAPGRYYYAPSERELREIYRRIAVSIPCR